MEAQTTSAVAGNSGNGSQPAPRAPAAEPTKPSPGPGSALPPARPATPAFAGVQVVFHGMTLLVIPADKSKGYVDVAFINTRINPALAVYYHAPTLKIGKELVHAASTATPVASDLDYGYYALVARFASCRLIMPTPSRVPTCRARISRGTMRC